MTNTILKMNRDLTNKKLYPVRTVIVYKDKKQYADRYHLETRDILQVNGKYVLGAAVPTTVNMMKDIAAVFIKNGPASLKSEGIIPEHILYTYNENGRTVVMWYHPEKKSSLNFSAATKIKQASEVSLPALLYCVIDTALYIFALRTNDRPSASTKVYKAPFFNIYTDGRVCLGTAKVGVRAKTFEGEAERFERAFFLAEQSGGEHNVTKSPITQLWNNLIKSKAKFPSDKELIEHPKLKTVGAIISNLIKGNNY